MDSKENKTTLLILFIAALVIGVQLCGCVATKYEPPVLIGLSDNLGPEWQEATKKAIDRWNFWLGHEALQLDPDGTVIVKVGVLDDSGNADAAAIYRRDCVNKYSGITVVKSDSPKAKENIMAHEFGHVLGLDHYRASKLMRREQVAVDYIAEPTMEEMDVLKYHRKVK